MSTRTYPLTPKMRAALAYLATQPDGAYEAELDRNGIAARTLLALQVRSLVTLYVSRAFYGYTAEITADGRRALQEGR